MPANKKSTKPRRRPAPRHRPRANPRQVTDLASCSVKTTLNPTGGGQFTGNAMYNLRGTIKLANFPRASTISQAYQFYRIKSVRMTYMWPYDTFQDGVGSSIAKPNLYCMIDKSESIPTLASLETLKQMGARPKAVDEKPTTFTFQPAVLQNTETIAGTAPTNYEMSPWISSSHTDVPHQGLFWYAEQQFGGVNTYVVDIEIQVEFKKPLWGPTSSSVPAVSSVPALLDNSTNGIVDAVA